MPYACDFQACDDGIQRLIRDSAGNSVSIAACQDRMLIVLAGEPSVEAIVNCLLTGLHDGWLQLSMKTLIDLNGYFGVIDWGELNKLRHLADWGGDDNEPSKVAYLVRNGDFRFVINALSALFGHTQHRLFVDRARAVEWLKN